VSISAICPACAKRKHGDLCSDCHDKRYPTAIADGAYHDGREAGHAAGYAEAVADVVAFLRSSRPGDAAEIAAGAHVGAAKKGGGT
jgi:hypothetical protein